MTGFVSRRWTVTLSLTLVIFTGYLYLKKDAQWDFSPVDLREHPEQHQKEPNVPHLAECGVAAKYLQTNMVYMIQETCWTRKLKILLIHTIVLVHLCSKVSLNDIAEDSVDDCRESFWKGYRQGHGDGGFRISVSHPAVETSEGFIPEVVYQGMEFICLNVPTIGNFDILESTHFEISWNLPEV